MIESRFELHEGFADAVVCKKITNAKDNLPSQILGFSESEVASVMKSVVSICHGCEYFEECSPRTNIRLPMLSMMPPDHLTNIMVLGKKTGISGICDLVQTTISIDPEDELLTLCP